MKYLTAILSLCFASQSFAGAYSFDCSSADKTLVIEHGSVIITQADGTKFEAIYFSESSEMELSYPMQEFLQNSEANKAIVEAPYWVNNKVNKTKIISERSFKDECGNSGTKKKFQGYFRVLNMQGIEIKAPTKLVCKYTGITGHCY